MNDLQRLGVKPHELEAIGMGEFLKNNKNLTKEDIIGFAERNRPVMNEIQLGKDSKLDIEHSKGNSNQLYYDYVYQEGLPNITDSYDVKFSGNLVGHIFETDENRPEFYVYSELADMVEGPFSKKSEAEDALKKELEIQDVGFKPKHEHHYRTKGGENYREILVQAPNKYTLHGTKAYDDIAKQMYGKDWLGLTSEERKNVANTANPQQFTKGHYQEHPNTMINMRMDDRVDVDGKKGTLLDELQSDWHQMGKEEGYASTNPFLKMPQMSADEMLLEYGDQMSRHQQDYLKAFIKNWEQINQSNNPEEIKSRMLDDRAENFQRWIDRQKIANAIPDAPYKNNWYELGLKKAIQQSVEKGDDRLYLSNGDTLADRYNLQKHIQALSYEKKGDQYRLRYVPKNGGEFQSLGEDIPEDKLADYVGKEMAQKIVNKEGQRAGSTAIHTFFNTDLKVGGEGMRKYYDEIYPSFIKKFANKYGGHVGETEIKTNPEFYHFVDENGDLLSSLDFNTEEHAELMLHQMKLMGDISQDAQIKKTKSKTQKVYYYEPSPEAKKKIMGGLPYKDGGRVKMADGGSIESDPSLPLRAHLRNFQTPDLLNIQDYGVSAQDNGDAFTLGRQIANKNAEEENPNLRYRASQDYAQYSTPVHQGMLNARVMKDPEQPSVQAMLQYMQQMGGGTAGVGLMGNRTSEGDKLRALQMMYNKRLSDTSDISGMLAFPFGDKPQFNVQYRKRFADGGIVDTLGNFAGYDSTPPETQQTPKPTTDAFQEALKFTLAHEGGFNAQKHDKPTNYGITQDVYSKYIGKPASIDDLKNMPVEHAHEIYRTQYWNPIQKYNLDVKPAVVAFDTAVNQGPTFANNMLKQTQGDIEAMMQARQNRYADVIKKNPKKAKFKAGWDNRMADLKNYAMEDLYAKGGKVSLDEMKLALTRKR